VLFRDLDGTASISGDMWNKKWQSMLDGFAAEEIFTGVPMIPNPKPKRGFYVLYKTDINIVENLKMNQGMIIRLSHSSNN
jgi:hypothetical protein